MEMLITKAWIMYSWIQILDTKDYWLYLYRMLQTYAQTEEGPREVLKKYITDQEAKFKGLFVRGLKIPGHVAVPCVNRVDSR